MRSRPRPTQRITGFAGADTAIATLALWTLFTYIYQVWSAVPYSSIGGPLNSGKTRVFEILTRLAFLRGSRRI